MSLPFQNPAIAKLIGSAMAHHAVGNAVSAIGVTRQNSDPDLGQGGTATEVETPINPEPMLSAIRVDTVLRSGDALRFSDLRMSVQKDALPEAVAMNITTEFHVNGVRYKVVTVTPAPSTWEFIIRRAIP
jgi:hypothetical protein